MAKVKRKSKLQNLKTESPFKNYWGKENYILLIFGVTVVFLGFYLMTFGPYDNPISLTVSPLVLLVAYIVILPLSIFYKKKKN